MIEERYCRNCKWWFAVTPWQGQCKLRPWIKPRWSQSSRTHCLAYTERQPAVSIPKA